MSIFFFAKRAEEEKNIFNGKKKNIKIFKNQIKKYKIFKPQKHKKKKLS